MCATVKLHSGVLPPALPGVRNAADDGAEHQRSHEGEEHKVDEAFQAVIAQSRHRLDIVLHNKEQKAKTNVDASN